LEGGFSEADLSRARRDTPGCEEVADYALEWAVEHAKRPAA
jgi:hypothetical protein